MNKAKLKRKLNININKKDSIVILVIFIIISLLLSFIYINKKVTPLILSVAKNETEKMATLVINNAVNNEAANSLDTDKLFTVLKSKDGTIN